MGDPDINLTGGIPPAAFLELYRKVRAAEGSVEILKIRHLMVIKVKDLEKQDIHQFRHMLEELDMDLRVVILDADKVDSLISLSDDDLRDLGLQRISDTREPVEKPDDPDSGDSRT